MNGEPRSEAQAQNSKQWEGHVVDGAFPLRHYLDGDETGAVFETEFEGQRAAIKLVEAAGRAADQLIWHWRLASKVSHPHLIPLWKVGRCQLEGTALAYVVMESAEENLGQVLAERPLTPAEAKEMLTPALDAMACIHREGFVHGRFTPANIMAVNDCLKLSSDSLRRAGDVDDRPPLQGAFRAPEVAAGGKLAPAGDIWALGVTLVETLTQRRPAWTGADNQLVIPEGVGEPFRAIVRRCLAPHPQERCTAVEVAALLEAKPAPPKKSRAIWYAVPAVAAVAILAVWLGRSSTEPIRPSVTSSRPAPTPESPPVSASQEKPAPREQSPVPAPPAPVSKPEPAPPAADIASPPPAAEPAPEPVAETPSTSPDVLNQPMPDVLEKARRSIQGTVNVNVKVHADAYGAVREATLESPHVSRYFSGVALKTVRRWKFRPVKEGETFVPQDWTVRFEFTRAATKVQVDHVAP